MSVAFKGEPTMKLSSNVYRAVGASVMAAAIALGTAPKPAAANEGTTNTILGVAAAIALGVTAANVSHKNAVANTVEGYTPNGETVYQDGHVVLPNGQSYYPGNNNQSIACDNGACDISGGGPQYGYNGYNGGYYNGNERRYPQRNGDWRH